MIVWDEADLAEPDCDLCSRYKGKYVDVVRSYNDTWWPMYDGEHILDRNGNEGLPTREDAINFLEAYLKEKFGHA